MFPVGNKPDPLSPKDKAFLNNLVRRDISTLRNWVLDEPVTIDVPLKDITAANLPSLEDVQRILSDELGMSVLTKPAEDLGKGMSRYHARIGGEEVKVEAVTGGNFLQSTVRPVIEGDEIKIQGNPENLSALLKTAQSRVTSPGRA